MQQVGSQAGDAIENLFAANKEDTIVLSGFC